MQSRMYQFLKSIGIAEPERFDLDFVLVARNPYQTQRVDMAIEKDSPWEYGLLEEFTSALANIRYPYSMRLSYKAEITAEDAVHLLIDWHLAMFQDVPSFATESPAPRVLSLTFPSQEEMDAASSKITSIKELFAFVNYPFSFELKAERKTSSIPSEVDVASDESPFEEVEVEENEEFLEVEVPPAPVENEEQLPHVTPEETVEETVEEAGIMMPEGAPSLEESSPIEVEGAPLEEVSLEDESIVKEEITEEPPSYSQEENVEIPAESPLEEPSFTEEENEELALSAETMSEEVSMQEWEASEAPIQEDIPSEESYTGEELIEMDRNQSLEEAEEILIKMKNENRRIMLEEQNKKRVWSTGDYKPVKHINEIFDMPLGNVDFSGVCFEGEARLSRKGNLFGTFGFGDDDGAINVRLISSKRLKEDKIRLVKPGEWFRIRGAIDVDRYSGQRIVLAHFLDPISAPEMRGDSALIKRVELHLHTNMSTQDGVGDIAAYAKLAQHMGMDAIAVTDHGSIQAFPAAQLAAKERCKKSPFKMIYGSELYLFDDVPINIKNPSPIPLKGARYCVFDTETTGLSSRYGRIIEFGGVIIEGGNVIRRWDTFINPEMDLSNSQEALAINHISEEELLRAPKMSEVLPQILEFIKGSILVAHNATFDVGFLDETLRRFHLPPINNPVIDTLALSHYFFPFSGKHNEGALLKNLNLQVYSDKQAHRADYDANALSEGWLVLQTRLEIEHPGIKHEDLAKLVIERGNLAWINDPNDPEDEGLKRYKEQEEKYSAFCRHIHEYHATVLCKNQQGLSALYEIISEAHTTYLGRAGLPKTPKHLLQKLREHLLVGTACFNSEIFEIAMNQSKEDLVEALRFYDYVEIQPLENYSFLLHQGKVPNKDILIDILRTIIECARTAGKIVVATGDVHYVNPEDKILRDVYINSNTIGGGMHPLNTSKKRAEGFPNPDQHFRSTDEMLASFSTWMSEEEANEIVVTNSRLIADMISPDVTPVYDQLFKPDANLPNADKILHDICYQHFEERFSYLYGDDDPEVLEAIANTRKRLDRELEGIIGNGYAVTYIIAARLIKMANDEPEHYIVGSRGSVGSSFAANMADITEVNPLPAHYQCSKCHYLHFEDTSIYKSGFDLPDKKCPKCGTLMHGNGQNIPFETFLGFAAEKVPDIDLNFEDESQKKAHNYCRILLGQNNVYRAGTIETVAEKTAYGYVRKYFESIGKDPDTINPAYVAYLASRCQGVKRTTGQHPGAIIVVPADHSLYEFTAIQHPADDLKSDWLTTHYDFHAVHDEILKLDILGHVDPMAMRYYRDLTGVRIEDIPMNDPEVLKLFTSCDPLKLERNYLNSKTGAAALPEFGTNQGLSMLEETQPKTFNDLLIISGLAHGTNVWANNAEDLVVKEGKTLNDVIGCRDDIMTYLISKGIEPGKSFKIMEQVRKGKKVSPEQAEEMREHGVPEYYIASCNKIAYLFPRGHATAYVMMAVRVAYFKLYYPLHFYAVFFSIRSDDYDIKSMIAGEEAVIGRIEALRARMGDRENPLSNKEENIYKTLLIAIEMLERGYHFSNIDLYRSDYKMFVVDEKNKALIPPFGVIDGLGESAGRSICEARYYRDKDGNVLLDENGNPRIKEFLSKSDLLDRASKLNSANLAALDALDVLKGMPETNQLTLF